MRGGRESEMLSDGNDTKIFMRHLENNDSEDVLYEDREIAVGAVRARHLRVLLRQTRRTCLSSSFILC